MHHLLVIMQCTNSGKSSSKIRTVGFVEHVFTDELPFLLPNQQHQNTEGKLTVSHAFFICKSVARKVGIFAANYYTTTSV